MADRRMATDETNDSIPSSLVNDAAIAQLVENAEMVSIDSSMPAPETLKRFLSVRSVLSTASSFALAQQEAQDQAPRLTNIGEGFCAIVYDLPGTGRVVKAAKANRQNELWVDFNAHVQIFKASTDYSSFFVPRPAYYCASDRMVDWIEYHGQQLPTSTTMSRESNDVLCAERILPLPKVVRLGLIEEFCPENQKLQATTCDMNRSCLVRLYLGRRRQTPAYNEARGPFTLRNFELTLDKMEHLGIDPIQYVRPMAEALATTHWRAHRDARDVEFVLGTAPDRRPSSAKSLEGIALMEPRTTTFEAVSLPDDKPNFLKRTVGVWLLDFNQCGMLGFSPWKAAAAFWDNDPYYPRPNHGSETTDGKLWEEFKRIYLEESERITGISVGGPPGEFIGLLEAQARNKAATSVMLEPPPMAGTSSSSRPPAIQTADRKKRKQRRYVS